MGLAHSPDCAACSVAIHPCLGDCGRGDPASTEANAGLSKSICALILIVDDDPVQRAMVREALADEGSDIYGAVDGRDGLQKAESLESDLIILDVMMPELDGFETCSRFRSTPKLRRILVLMLRRLTRPIG